MSEPKAGRYKGHAVAGSEQFGYTKNGGEQIALDVYIPDVGQFTTRLYFTEAAAPHSLARLRACGWDGKDPTKLTGIDANEIEIEIKYETFQGKERMKVGIVSGGGGGQMKLDTVMSDAQKRDFAARLMGAKGGGAGSGKPGDDIPFAFVGDAPARPRRWERW